MEMLSSLGLSLDLMVKIVWDGCINAWKKIWVIWSTPKSVWGEEEGLGHRRGMFTVPKHVRVTD